MSILYFFVFYVYMYVCIYRSVISRAIYYDNLQSRQVVNHFQKASAITSKLGLCKNIRSLRWYAYTVYTLFISRGINKLYGIIQHDIIIHMRVIDYYHYQQYIYEIVYIDIY